MHKLARSDHHKHTKHFNLMVVGAAGVGKSSFIEMFLKKFNLKAYKKEFSSSQCTIQELEPGLEQYGQVIR